MRARHWWSCLLACPLACLATVGTAEGAVEPPRSLVFLEWTRGPGAEACLSESELIEEVEVSLRRHAFTERSRADRVLRAQIQQSDASPRWRAQIGLSTARDRSLGGREITIDSESCDEASESLVLALALMIDLPPTPAEIEERRTKKEEEESAASWHLSGGLGPSAAVDSSPSVRGGAHASLVVTAGRFWPVVADAFFWVQSATGGAGSDPRSFWLARSMLGVGICPVTIQGARLGVAACIGPQAELVTGWGAGFAKDRVGLAVAFGGLAQSSVTYRLGRHVRAVGTLGVAATPQRVDFTFLDERGVERPLHRTSPVNGVGSFRLAVDFF